MDPLRWIDAKLSGRTRKVVIAITGTLLILLGIVSGFLPFSPGFVLILLGLGVLSTAFPWARRTRHKVEAKWTEYKRRYNRRRARRSGNRVS